jgi:cyclase
VDTVVPGHGPLTDAVGVRAVGRYFTYVKAEAARRHADGMSAVDAAFDIDLGEFADWGDSERIVVTVETVYRDLDPARPPADAQELFRQMGRYHRERRGAGRR